MSTKTISHLLETAVKTAIAAGKRSMIELNNINCCLKSPSEMVTQADPICQQIIIDYIKKEYPQHGFIAEEGPDNKMLFAPPSSNCDMWWIIDPIDGTNNYAHGLSNFCVSIAVMHQGIPIVAVIYDPTTDSLFTATCENNTEYNRAAVSCSNEGISCFSSFAVDSHFEPPIEKAVFQIMKATRFRCLGSTALHMAYTAKGSLIGGLTISARLWDIAAGVLLIEKSGGIISTLSGEKVFPIDLNLYKSERFRLIWSNQNSHEEIMKIFTF